MPWQVKKVCYEKFGSIIHGRGMYSRPVVFPDARSLPVDAQGKEVPLQLLGKKMADPERS